MNIVKPSFKVHTVNREELFRRILGTADYSKCTDGTSIAGVTFNAMFPVLQRIIGDNEVLLQDNQEVNKQYADLDVKYKVMEKNYGELLEKAAEAGIEFQERSLEEIQKGS